MGRVAPRSFGSGLFSQVILLLTLQLFSPFLWNGLDSEALLEKMREAASLRRGTPGMADTVSATRAQMNDFVALYRRNTKVAGSLSFNTLYTAINTLSGHFATYGPNYPVPEKRRKRLEQQFSEIERALARGR